jgi:hypothetical protein
MRAVSALNSQDSLPEIVRATENSSFGEVILIGSRMSFMIRHRSCLVHAGRLDHRSWQVITPVALGFNISPEL